MSSRKRPPGLRRHLFRHGRVARLRGQCGEVHHRQREVIDFADLLHRLAIDHGEHRAQHLVAADDLLQTAGQHGDV